MVQVSTVWDRTTEFVSDNLGSIVPVAILTLFVPISVQASLNAAATGAAPATQAALQLIVLVMSLVMMFGGLALVALALDAAIGAGPALRVALRRLPAALLVGAVLFVALLILCVPFAALFGPGGMQVADGGLSVTGTPDLGIALALSAYGIVLAVVLLFVGARLILVDAAVVGEERGLSAIARSWRLTRGLTFKIVGVLILYGVVNWVATIATRSVIGTLLRLLTGDEGGLSIPAVVAGVLSGAVSTAFAVLAYVFVAKLYLAASGPVRAPAPLGVA